ncbi:MAG: hypothetical protein ACFFED_06215 [Candidatus Thorarchaeota archaeon]
MLGEWILGSDERWRNSISLKLSVNTAALLSIALQNAAALTDTDNNEIELSIKQIKRKKKIRGKEKDVVVGRWTVTVNAKATDS